MESLALCPSCPRLRPAILAPGVRDLVRPAVNCYVTIIPVVASVDPVGCVQSCRPQFNCGVYTKASKPVVQVVWSAKRATSCIANWANMLTTAAASYSQRVSSSRLLLGWNAAPHPTKLPLKQIWQYLFQVYISSIVPAWGKQIVRCIF